MIPENKLSYVKCFRHLVEMFCGKTQKSTVTYQHGMKMMMREVQEGLDVSDSNFKTMSPR